MASILKIGDSWRVQIRRKGQTDTKTFPNKAKAEVWARRREAEIDAGKSVADLDTLRLSRVIETYRTVRESSNPIADTSNTHYMLKRLEEGLGDMFVGKMKPSDLIAYCQARADEGAGPYTCNMEISQLGTTMKYSAGFMDVVFPDLVAQSRPMLMHLKLIGGGNKRVRRPTEDEVVGILAQLGQPYADAVVFAIGTALRRAEITRLLWEDVDEQKKLVLVRDRKHPRMKEANNEWIPLLGSTWELLQRQPRVSDRIFPIHPQTISKYFKAACDALSIPDLHFHDLRHEGTSRLFESGYLIEQVALVTGHKKWENLKRYTNLRPESLHRD